MGKREGINRIQWLWCINRYFENTIPKLVPDSGEFRDSSSRNHSKFRQKLVLNGKKNIHAPKPNTIDNSSINIFKAINYSLNLDFKLPILPVRTYSISTSCSSFLIVIDISLLCQRLFLKFTRPEIFSKTI